ncbi:MAG: alpha-2-macroglobulin family protein, partial [Candidatus Methylomirabilis sp.]|nr:alpha-2-macroglobulin family protein [Deltaproteobacteria bacterium]
GLARGGVALASDARGFAAFEHEIPPYARTGGHSLELLVADEVIGTYRFQVEEFVPDRIKVALSPDGPPPAAGGELRYEVACAYLFGPPCAGLPVETRVRLEAAPFAPKGYEGFVFGDPDRKFDAREIFFEQGALGEDGKGAYAARIPASLAPPAGLSALVSARVREHGGRGMNAQYRLPVHPVPYYLGLRRPGAGYAEPEKPVAVEWVAVSPQGEAAPAGALRAEFFAVRWNTTLRRTPSGSWRYESSREMRSLASRTLEAGSTGGSLSFTPPGYGSYAVALTDPATGAAARIEFYASGWGYAPWAIENPARVELDLDKDEYAPGDRAVAQVRAPFSGKLLLAIGRGGLYDVQVHDLAGNTGRVEIPIREDMRPNAYV